MQDAPSPTDSTNDEQVRYWNEVAGPRWVLFQERLDRELAQLGVLAMERAGLAAGESALDVGCGCGGATLELGRRVGPSGRALGVDVSQPMLDHARARAKAAGAANVSFLEADAQSAGFGERFDLVFSRFGVMFFADPAAAFGNLRRALRPGGRISFVCWQPLADNPWMLVPLGALAKHLMLPPPPPAGAPGPFALADAERVSRLLAAAGFAGIVCDDVREPLRFGGGDLDGAVDFALEIGPAAHALREAAAGPELRAQVAASVREALAPFAAGGSVAMPSAAWRFGARNPG